MILPLMMIMIMMMIDDVAVCVVAVDVAAFAGMQVSDDGTHWGC